jgi:hypothetical protein
MRFGPWYLLAEADRHAPVSGGVFQIRIPDGLLDYPGGKSAMVHYEAAGDLRGAIAAFRAAHPDGAAGWLCRHTIEMTAADVAGAPDFFARLVRDFTARFGTSPRIPT